MDDFAVDRIIVAVGFVPEAASLAVICLDPDEVEAVSADLPNAPEPSGPHAMFYYDLYYRKVSRSFLRACAGCAS